MSQSFRGERGEMCSFRICCAAAVYALNMNDVASGSPAIEHALAMFCLLNMQDWLAKCASRSESGSSRDIREK